MKPITLTLCGWGPFRDKQTVDFTKVSEKGIFLITGQTGAGKTTIFDGITYALYGSMSGRSGRKQCAERFCGCGYSHLCGAYYDA